MQNWRPSTCECVLQFNGVNEPANFQKVISKCSAHQAVADTDLTAVLLLENQSVNQAIHAFKETHPNLDGPDVTVRVMFEGTGKARVPHVQFIGLRGAIRPQDRAAYATEFSRRRVALPFPTVDVVID